MLSYFVEILALSHHIILYLAYGLSASFLCSHKVTGRIDGDLIQFVYECTCHGINDRNLLDLVTEELDSDCILAISYTNIHCITTHSESTSFKLCFGTAIQSIDQLIQQPCHTSLLTSYNFHCLGVEILRITDTIKARHT